MLRLETASLDFNVMHAEERDVIDSVRWLKDAHDRWQQDSHNLKSTTYKNNIQTMLISNKRERILIVKIHDLPIGRYFPLFCGDVEYWPYSMSLELIEGHRNNLRDDITHICTLGTQVEFNEHLGGLIRSWIELFDPRSNAPL